MYDAMNDAYQKRCDHLLKRAQGGQWDSDARLDWAQDSNLAQVTLQSPLISPALSDVWLTLPESHRSEAVRRLMGNFLSNLAVGEVFVDESLTALEGKFPHIKLQDVLDWQIKDEVRHAKVLHQYLDHIQYFERDKRKAAASRLEADTIAARNQWESAAMLVMILEIAATAAIQGLRAYCNEPLALAMLKGIVGDESRHISGMTLALRAYEQGFDEKTRAMLKDTAILGWHQALAVTETPACAMADTLDAEFAGRQSNTTSWPFFRKTLSDILLPKLKLLGLLDEDLSQRLIAAGCPVPAIHKAQSLRGPSLGIIA